jgi:hypothetical protein
MARKSKIGQCFICKKTVKAVEEATVSKVQGPNGQSVLVHNHEIHGEINYATSSEE